MSLLIWCQKDVIRISEETLKICWFLCSCSHILTPVVGWAWPASSALLAFFHRFSSMSYPRPLAAEVGVFHVFTETTNPLAGLCVPVYMTI